MRAWLLFIAVSVLWGIPFALIKVAVDHGVSPAAVAAARVAIGAVVLLPLAWRAGVLRGIRGRLGWVAAYALAEIVIPFPLLAFGEQRVSSSLAAILVATAPLFVALLALRFDAAERLSRERFVGLTLGLAGVVALVGVDVGGHSGLLLGVGCVLAVAFGYSIAAMILKGHLDLLDPRATMSVSLTLAAAVLAPAAVVQAPTGLPSAAAIVALVALGIFCTALALVLYAALVAETGAGRALVVTYLNPVVAVFVGLLFLDERPTFVMIAGLALILVGAWLSTQGRLSSHRRRGRSPGGTATHARGHTRLSSADRTDVFGVRAKRG